MEPESPCLHCGQLLAGLALVRECPICAMVGLCRACLEEHEGDCQVGDDPDVAVDPGPDGADELDHDIWEVE